MAEDPEALATRRRLYDEVVRTPGSTARELQRAAVTEWGETTMHLLRLEAAGHVRRERGTAQEFYFPTAVAAPDPALRRLAGSTTERDLLIALLEFPGSSLPALARRLGRGSGALGAFLRPTLASGAVRGGREEGRRVFRVTDRRKVGQFLATHSGGYYGQFVDGFTEVWGEILPPL